VSIGGGVDDIIDVLTFENMTVEDEGSLILKAKGVYDQVRGDERRDIYNRP
jgi:hypothetical protein